MWSFYLGGSQKLGPILVPLKTRRRNEIYNQKGPNNFENNPFVVLGFRFPSSRLQFQAVGLKASDSKTEG